MGHVLSWGKLIIVLWGLWWMCDACARTCSVSSSRCASPSCRARAAPCCRSSWSASLRGKSCFLNNKQVCELIMSWWCFINLMWSVLRSRIHTLGLSFNGWFLSVKPQTSSINTAEKPKTSLTISYQTLKTISPFTLWSDMNLHIIF